MLSPGSPEPRRGPGAWHEVPIVRLRPSPGLFHGVTGQPQRSPPGHSQGAPGHLPRAVGSRRGAGPGPLFGARQPTRRERAPLLSRSNLPHAGLPTSPRRGPSWDRHSLAASVGRAGRHRAPGPPAALGLFHAAFGSEIWKLKSMSPEPSPAPVDGEHAPAPPPQGCSGTPPNQPRDAAEEFACQAVRPPSPGTFHSRKFHCSREKKPNKPSFFTNVANEISQSSI